MSRDEQFMRLALAEARRGEGLTRPNPPVGAVLVDAQGEVLASGWHAKAGAVHAERDCLVKISEGIDLSGATLYVTLEPCCTVGRTPACVDIILERGVGRVVVGVEDPNPAHAGAGIKRLRAAGIDVLMGVCAAEAGALIEPFACWICDGRPFVTLKMAMTLDGRIADAAGDSKWISGEASRAEVQALRRRVDAVMVGAETVRRDDPGLLPRPAKGRMPWRVVMGGDVPVAAGVLCDEAAARTLVRGGDVDEVLRGLAAEQDVMHVLCEGGGMLAGALLEAGLVDEFLFFVAPKLLGSDGRPVFNMTGLRMDSLKALSILDVKQLDEDVMIRARVKE